MKTSQTADTIPAFIDLVFARRNRAYGAYQLRLSESAHLLKGLSLSLCILILALWPLHWRNGQGTFEARILPAVPPNVLEKIYVPNKTEIASGVPAGEKVQKKKINIQDRLPEAVDKVMENKSTDHDTPSNTDGTSSALSSSGGEWPDVGENAGGALISGRENTESKALPTAILEIQPSFPGGEEAMFRFLKKYIKYPLMAKELGQTGTVYVSFIINAQGEIIQVKALNKIGYGLDEEAERVVKIMPRWSPGQMGNRNVSVSFVLPIRFQLAPF